MPSPVGSVAVSDAVARVEAALDELRALEPERLSSDELLALVRGLEGIRRKLPAIECEAIASVERRSLPMLHGCRSTAALLRSLLHIAPGEAAHRVLLARSCGPRRAVTGAALAPEFAFVATALADGAINDRHARTIVDAVEHLPLAVREQAGEWFEQHLVETARHTDPAQVAAHARAVGHALDHDGSYRDLAHRERTRAFTLHLRGDGSSRAIGDLTPELTEHLLTLFDALAKPASRTVDGVLVDDERSAEQRRHDALLAAATLLERSGELPGTGGVSASICLTMDVDAWTSGRGLARTGHGYAVPADVARRWAGSDAELLLALLSRTRGIEAYSSSMRLATAQQRRALVARDGGCAMPGCDAPPAWTQAHHVVPWAQSRRTCVDGLALLCSADHHNLDHNGWQIAMIEGRPWAVPPPWIDPEQRPRRNTRHDLPRAVPPHPSALHDSAGGADEPGAASRADEPP